MSNLKHHLLQLDKEDLVELLLTSTKRHKNWKSLLLQKAAAKLSEGSTTEDLSSLYLEQYQTLADQAFAIIHEHNEYGGGPDDEYDRVDSYLSQINKLFTEHKLSPDIKRQYVDQLFRYYDWDNSGLTDMLMESIEQVSETQDDWQCVVAKLEQPPKSEYRSAYRQKLIADIYKTKLQDDEAYLTIRLQNLEHSGDYYDLVTYWEGKGQLAKATEIAKVGVNASEHGGIELLEWLFGQSQNDYSLSLGYLQQIFQREPCLSNYQNLSKFARAADWPKINTECRTILSEHRPYDLALIQYQAKEYDQVLEFVLSSKRNPSMFYMDSQKEELALKLIEHFPHQLLPYFQAKVQNDLDRRERVYYAQAAEYAKIVKKIYLSHLNQSAEWQQYLDQIRSDHIKQPALLEEFTKL